MEVSDDPKDSVNMDDLIGNNRDEIIKHFVRQYLKSDEVAAYNRSFEVSVGQAFFGL